VLSKIKRKATDSERDLYRLVFDKIARENEKIEKSITTIEEKMDLHPRNIIEMLELEKLVREESI
jgi:S-adenosylmethionine synthetase